MEYPYSVSARRRTERTHPVRYMLMNRRYGDAELGGDLLVRLPPPEGSDDLALAVGEAICRTQPIGIPCFPSSSSTGTFAKCRAARLGVHHEITKARVCFGSLNQLGLSFPSVRLVWHGRQTGSRLTRLSPTSLGNSPRGRAWSQSRFPNQSPQYVHRPAPAGRCARYARGPMRRGRVRRAGPKRRLTAGMTPHAPPCPRLHPAK